MSSVKRLLTLILSTVLMGPVSLVTVPLLLQPQSSEAHEVEVSGEVGGTLHIAPDDNPRAGVPSQAWFALTRRGGQPIALSDCNCSLTVYALPHLAGDAPVQQPSLTATNAEGNQAIPSATITFPQAGAYELVLQGNPVTPEAFTPFTLTFSVTVAQ